MTDVFFYVEVTLKIDSLCNVCVGSRGHRNHGHHEEEPEWFTAGPTSKTDTIELCGFDKEETTRDERGFEQGKQMAQDHGHAVTNETNAGQICFFV